eukprot:4115688-Amphidinium_carterae.3
MATTVADGAIWPNLWAWDSPPMMRTQRALGPLSGTIVHLWDATSACANHQHVPAAVARPHTALPYWAAPSPVFRGDGYGVQPLAKVNLPIPPVLNCFSMFG